MAVGVPANARPGVYEVTLTARLANGQTRTAKGRLTISGVSIEGRTAAGRPRLVAILPRGLTATLVRSQGLAVVIGSNRRGVARVQLLQGRGGRRGRPSRRASGCPARRGWC